MTKLYSLPLCLFLIFCSFSGFSQHTIEGRVLDVSGEPVAFANVILLNAQDSTSVYKGAVSAEDGFFTLKSIEADNYLLKISFVGFENLLQRIEVTGNKDLGDIVLNEDTATLSEVSINYKNPSVKREVDRLVFSVENTTLSTGTSWDILKRTPGVILSGNSLMVRNQGVQVYINDRKVQLTAAELQTLLENYSAENIKSVEVITTPPARYDAEGGAILNIVTTKSIAPGYKGNINGAWTQAVYPKFQAGTSHYYKTDKLNLFGNYTYSARKEYKEDDSYINFRNSSEEIFTRWETDFERTTRSNAHTANILLDYNFDEKNILNFSSSLSYSPNETFDNNVSTSVFEANEEVENLITHSELEEDISNAAFDLEFRHLLDKPGAQISAKTHYTRYDQNRDQGINTRIVELGAGATDYAFNTKAQQEIDIFTAQLDYATPIGSTSFESGIKASVISSESGIDYFRMAPDTSTYIFDEDQSDNFLYDEHIYAAYFSLARDWEKWSVKGGLRGEFTDRTGDSRSMEQIDTREYFELFPTFYLQHSFNNNHSLSFDYSRRIQRPRYESLNPFRYYLTEFDYNSGNPNLKASVSNNFTLGYALKNEYFFDLYYRDSGETPQTLSFQDNDQMLVRRVSMNLLESKSYGLDITHGRSVANWWYAYAYVSLFNEERTFVAIESGDVPVTLEIDGFYGSLYNNVIISKDGTLTGELTLTYVSDWLSGSYKMDPMTTLSLGLRKTFWNNRAELSVNVEDLLDETNTWLRSRYLNQDNGYYPRPETRYVRLGFKYNFGNFRLSDNQRAIEAAERDRI
ncbi:TonB-dependent receptor [Salinimicrobium tongyeongense]|uniref:TonB-dependent receptor n=1 Tax=Salinimicrobium tongyeongense TaxID=2809707 RepID=A0ABY6NUW5_9FLAO|nr:outer membrane beta-barrel family protein [Salinimicrobium tongyeongense]UZH56712.1 TonB-dependent receptor [Salinimicrobium tongyeongense]